MRGSGYTEILQDADLVTNGSLSAVLKGKAFTKGVFCLRLVVDALTRLLINEFTSNYSHEKIDTPALLQLIENIHPTKLNQAHADPSTTLLVQEFLQFKQKIREGLLGKTAMFWMSFLDQATILFLMMWAIKHNDRPLYHKCNAEMANLFFAFDGHNYSRYLAWFDLYLTNLELTHPGAMELIDAGAISVARSRISGTREATDRVMEETFMRSSHGKGGYFGIYQNPAADLKWNRTSTAKLQFYETTLDICGLTADSESESGMHKDVRKNRAQEK